MPPDAERPGEANPGPITETSTDTDKANSTPRTVTIPTCCPRHRLAALETFELLVANDAAAELVSMLLDGWRAGDAVDAYRTWMHSLIDDCIDFGVGWVATDLAVEL